jgi:hypothetical protein
MADFATVAALEEFLGTTGLGARGTAMLGYASAAIRGYCHQDLEETLGRQEEHAGDAGRYVLEVTQRPITALSSITIDAVVFEEFWANYIVGHIYRLDGGAWADGPIVVTYDSGYAADSDEMADIKSITLEVAARAITGPPETFGLEVQELRGVAPAIYLTEEERAKLARYAPVGVG